METIFKSLWLCLSCKSISFAFSTDPYQTNTKAIFKFSKNKNYNNNDDDDDNNNNTPKQLSNGQRTHTGELLKLNKSTSVIESEDIAHRSSTASLFVAKKVENSSVLRCGVQVLDQNCVRNGGSFYNHLITTH